MRFRKIGLALIFIHFTLQVNAEVKLPKFFSSGMVFQRHEPINIWGFGASKEQVTVSFNGKSIKTKANKLGKWLVTFPSLLAGGPYNLEVKSKSNTIVLDDILIGDVWLCSGQSNMEYAMKRTSWAPQEAPKANFPNIRILKVQRAYANYPREDVNTQGWNPVTPASILNFSAPAYFFGSELHQEENVPIGLILSAYSGSDIISWLSEPSLEDFPYIHKVLEQRRELYNKNNLGDLPNVKQIRQNFVQEQALQFLPFDSLALDSKSYKETLDLPFKFSDIPDLKNFIGEVYLQKSFTVPSFFEQKSLQFRLARWDDYAEFFINGVKIHTSVYKKDWVMVNVQPELINVGRKNTLTVRLVNLSDDGGTTDKNEFYLYHPVNERTSMNFLSGKWQYFKGNTIPNAVEPLQMSNEFAQCRSTPSGTFNAMIHPLMDFSFKGVIWYQGENNTSRAYEYRKLFPAMITDWREQLHQKELPFLYVQLPNCRPENDTVFNSKWAELREAQAMALKLPNTAMITAIDIGEAKNIHPENKQDIGHRLFLAAQKLVYQKAIVHAGPTFKSLSIEDGKAVITFNHVGSGLIKKGSPYGYLKGFVVAGKDQQFYHAIGMIDGDQVVITCPHVHNPVAVRYAWADNPGQLNLYNAEGLPATPFRTDDWDGLTKNLTYEIDFTKIKLPKTQ